VGRHGGKASVFLGKPSGTPRVVAWALLLSSSRQTRDHGPAPATTVGAACSGSPERDGPQRIERKGKTMDGSTETVKIMQAECTRLHQYLSTLPPEAWCQPSA